MSKLARIRIGTRKSALALAQAKEVAGKLMEHWPHLDEMGAIELVPMTTSGDTIQDRPLSDIGGKGLFTKEIEDALLDSRIDIAVHSMKDMQTVLPDGLITGCMLEREDPRDVLVGDGLRKLSDLPDGATFGTSSLRRSAQVLMHRPDIKIVPLRGNVQTRLGKVQNGEIQATMLAQAGLNRLLIWDFPGAALDTEEFLPAVAQGAIGIECRQGDEAVMELLSPLADIDTETAVLCERAFLQALDGSCRTPIAGYATVEGDRLHFKGLIIRPDGRMHHWVEKEGNRSDAESLGIEAGEELLAKAGKNFLNCA
jgi:hydroxymethylbilane synthase